MLHSIKMQLGTTLLLGALLALASCQASHGYPTANQVDTSSTDTTKTDTTDGTSGASEE